MDDLVGPDIEKIKLQEQDKEAKLIEERELNATIQSLNRSIHDTTMKLEKLTKEYQSLVTTTDQLKQVLLVERIRKRAMSDLIVKYRKDLDELQKTSCSAMSAVWAKRNNLIEYVQNIAEKCDIRALLMRPPPDIKTGSISKPKCEETAQSDTSISQKLNDALERRSRAIALRDSLLKEPDVGDEFIRYGSRIFRVNRSFSSQAEAKENEPIKFSTSGASRNTMTPTFRGIRREAPWYQPYSVVASVTVFLVYFCILREENDIDKEFNKTLYDRIEGLEKEQLIQTYKFNIEHGKSVEDIEKRLKELEEIEKQTPAKSV